MLIRFGMHCVNLISYKYLKKTSLAERTARSTMAILE